MSLRLPAFPLQQAPPGDDIYDIVVLAPKASLLPILLWALLIIFLLAAIGIALVWWLLFRKPGTLPLSPRDRALRRLHELERREASMEPNEFALGLSEAIKDFLSETYGDPLRYETTEEFLRRNASGTGVGVPSAARRELVDFLSLADEVKFANSPDAAAHVSTLYRSAHSMIESCTRIAESPERSQPGGTPAPN